MNSITSTILWYIIPVCALIQPSGSQSSDHLPDLSTFYDSSHHLNLTSSSFPAMDSLLSCTVSLAEMQWNLPLPELELTSIFPSLRVVQSCMALNEHEHFFHFGPAVKFCHIKVRDNKSLADVLQGTNNPLRVSFAVGACLPSACTAAHVEWLADLVCKQPSCEVVSRVSSRLGELCATLQPLLCDGDDRTQLAHDIHFDCYEPSPSIQTNAERKLSFIAGETSEPAARNDAVVPQWLLQQLAAYLSRSVGMRVPSDDALTESSMTHTQIEALTACGSEAMSRPELVMYSGGFQNLGKYKECMDLSKAEALLYADSHTSALSRGCSYCTVKFLSFFTSGRCVPASCTEQRFNSFVDTVCEFTGGESPKNGHVNSREAGQKRSKSDAGSTCLDYVNIVPLDLCIIINLFGCPDSTPVLLSDTHDVSILMQAALFRKAYPVSQLIRDANKPRPLEPRHQRHEQQVSDAVNFISRTATKSLARDVLSSLSSFAPLKYPSKGDEIFGSSSYSVYNVTNSEHPMFERGEQDRNAASINCQSTHSTSRWFSFAGYVTFSIFFKIFVLLPLCGWLATTRGFSRVKRFIVTSFRTKGEYQPSVMHQVALAAESVVKVAFKGTIPTTNESAEGSWPQPVASNNSLTESLLEREKSQSKFALDPNNQNFDQNFRFFRKMCACFSVRHNLKAVQIQNDRLAQAPLSHVCGIRTIAMLWIILGHTFFFVMMSGTVKDLQSATSMLRDLDFQVVLSGHFAVDTFFFLSGFLLALAGQNSLKQVSTIFSDHSLSRFSKFIRLSIAYVHTALKRYARLFGPYVTVAVIAVVSTPFLISGPNIPSLVQGLRYGSAGGCSRYWWANVLYLNNVIPYGDQMECLPWTWYLANDFQFFLIGLLLLFVREWNKFAFRALAVTGLVSAYLTGWVVNYRYNIQVSVLQYSAQVVNTAKNINQFAQFKNSQEYYIRPWCRIPPHLIGVLIGTLVLHPNWNKKISSFCRTRFIVPGHFIATFIMATLVFLPYDVNKWNPNTWNRQFEIGFLTFSRSIWALCVAWFCVMLAYAPNSTQQTRKRQLPLTSTSDRICQNKDNISDHTLHNNDKYTDVPYNIIRSAPILAHDNASVSAKRFLSTYFFIMSSNLIYSLYLFHPILQDWAYGSYSVSYENSRATGYFSTVVFFTYGLILSAVVFVLVEVGTVKFFKLLGL